MAKGSRQKAVGRKQSRAPKTSKVLETSKVLPAADAPYDLPDGWTWTTLGQICTKPQYGFTTKAAEKGELKFLRITDLKERGVDWSNVPFCADVPPDPEKYLLQDGDLVIARAGSVGKAYRVLNPPKVIFGSYLIRFKAQRDTVYDNFLAYFLNSPEYWKQIQDSSTGTTMFNVNATKLAELRVPLPPLPEQQRIVARIEALFAESRTTRDALERVPALLKRFRQSVLASAFRGALTAQTSEVSKTSEVLPAADAPYDLPDGWTWKDLGDLLSFVGSGITPKGGQKIYLTSGIPFIRSQNVYSDGLRLDDVAYVSPKLHQEMSRTHLQANDVLLNITGASIGRSTVVPASFGQANVNQHVCILRTFPVLDSNYLSRFLNSPFGQDQIMESQSGVTRQGLNYTQIRALHIPLPPLPEQRRIVARIEALFAQADAIEHAVAIARKRADKIDQAILARAFRGEL